MKDLIRGINKEDPDDPTLGFQVKLIMPDGSEFEYNRIISHQCWTPDMMKFYWDDAVAAIEKALDDYDSG